MKKGYFCVLISVFLLLLPWGGCSKKKAGEALGKNAAPPAEGGQSLTLWVYDNGRVEVLTQLGKQFEAQYGVPVEIAMVELGDMRNQFLMASGGEETADLAIIPHDNLGGYAVNDAVLEIDLGDKTSEYLESSLEAFRYNGKLYGLPLAVENIGFFVNTSLTDKVPATWEELYAVGKDLVAGGKAEYAMGLPDSTYNSFPFYSAAGGYIFGKDASGALNPDDIGLNSEGFVLGLEFMVKMIEDGLIPKENSWDAAHVLFESNKAPFIFTGPWALNRFKEAGVSYTIAPFPSGGAPFLGVQGVIISAASPNTLLAQAFATEFLATRESMQTIYDAEQRPSAWKQIFENSGSPDVQGFNAAGYNAVPMPSIPEMGFVWDAWNNSASLALAGELSPQEALDNGTAQIKTQIEESR